MKIKLNKRNIDEAGYQGPGGYYLWDTDIAGFGLRIYPSGRKSFVITYRARGRQRFYIIGRFGELTVQQARAEALELLGRTRKGDDPAGTELLSTFADGLRLSRAGRPPPHSLLRSSIHEASCLLCSFLSARGPLSRRFPRNSHPCFVDASFPDRSDRRHVGDRERRLRSRCRVGR